MKRLASSLLSCLLLAGTATAAGAATTEDLDLESKVQQRLQRRGLDDEVNVMVEDGHVTLAGTVETLRQAERATAVTLSTHGVRGVDNYLHIASFGRNDDAIRGDLQDILDVHLNTQVFDWIEARVEGGKVLLTGRVYNPITQSRVARATAAVPGVWQVINSVEILPVSSFDDQLRRQALVALYSHPVFAAGAQNQPPIHIVVANGQIALKGTVSSRVQARLAESLVRSGTDHFGVDNQILVTSRIHS